MDNQEFTKDKSYITGRLKSIQFAVRGAMLLARNEHSVITQMGIGLLCAIAGFYFEITLHEWMLQVMAIGLVLAIEGLNTAVEKLCDFVHPGYHDKIGVIKDLAAGAVMFAAIAAITIGCLIYIPKILAL
jgi:diacylglycerol kinase (ATP)